MVEKQLAEEAKTRVGGRPKKAEKPVVNLPQVSKQERNAPTTEVVAKKDGSIA